jgi:hypothetical protein
MIYKICTLLKNDKMEPFGYNNISDVTGRLPRDPLFILIKIIKNKNVI